LAHAAKLRVAELRHAAAAVPQRLRHRTGGVSAETMALGNVCDTVWHFPLLLRVLCADHPHRGGRHIAWPILNPIRNGPATISCFTRLASLALTENLCGLSCGLPEVACRTPANEVRASEMCTPRAIV
jgi:hypothetical protein